jgi:hypothetical protein
LPSNDQRITAPGALEIFVLYGEDFFVGMKWIPNADRLGCGAVRSCHHNGVGILEEDQDRKAQLIFRQRVPVQPRAFNSSAKLFNQFDEMGGGQGAPVENGTVLESLYFRLISSAYPKSDQAG